MMNVLYNDIDEIIDNLYLGNLEAARNVTKLKELGIKKVLSVFEGYWPKYEESDNISHKIINITDYSNINIIKYFGECLNFIKGEEKVLVHCYAGSSRSASIVIAYLMWNKKMSFKEALNFVHNKRASVYPKPGFQDQLELFEKILKENDYDIDKIKFEEIKWEPKNYYMSQ